MSGNPDNAHAWDGDADVLVSFNLDAIFPSAITDDLPADFVPVGLVDGDAGFANPIDEPEAKHRAWNAGVIKTTYQGADIGFTWTSLEANDTTERLGRPNLREQVLLAVENHDAEGMQRKIARMPVKVRRAGDSTDKENGLTMIPFKCTLVADPDIDPADADPFWIVQRSEASGS